MELLASIHHDMQITESIVMAVVGNWGYRKDVMDMLLKTISDIQTTIKAKPTSAQIFDDRIMKLLIITYTNMQITKPIVTVEVGNEVLGKEMMQRWMTIHLDIQITESIVMVMMGNEGTCKKVM